MMHGIALSKRNFKAKYFSFHFFPPFPLFFIYLFVIDSFIIHNLSKLQVATILQFHMQQELFNKHIFKNRLKEKRRKKEKMLS